MSISNPSLQNPATKFLEFNGDAGTFRYYEKKEGEEKGENISVPYPFYFIVLDQMNTIKGYSEQYNCGIYANEVKSLNNEILTVKTFKKGLNISGKYSEIKGEIAKAGGKFCKSIYAMWIKGENDFELVNLQLKGAAFSSWMDANINTDAFAVKILANKEGKKGKVVYQMPVFEKLVIGQQRKNVWDTAIKMDKQLQKFFEWRKQQGNKAQEDQQVAEKLPENDFFDVSEQEDELQF